MNNVKRNAKKRNERKILKEGRKDKRKREKRIYSETNKEKSGQSRKGRQALNESLV